MKVYDYNQEFGGNYYQVSQSVSPSPGYLSRSPGLTSWVISADDPVHQQEGGLRSLHEEAGRVPASLCRGDL